MAARVFEIFALNIERVPRPAIFELHEPASGAFARNLTRRHHRVAQNHIARQDAFFEQREHERGRADFQRGCERAHV